MTNTDKREYVKESLEFLSDKYGVVNDPALNVKQSLLELLDEALNLNYAEGIYNANKLLAAHITSSRTVRKTLMAILKLPAMPLNAS